jgi:Glyoxalase/Bleomycin resistance protein/Dioxygenase superfamily
MNDAAAALQAYRRAAGAPAISFRTDDCRRRYEELRAKGAVFLSEPKQMDYGGTDAVFEDGCGNLLNLHQEGPGHRHGDRRRDPRRLSLAASRAHDNRQARSLAARSWAASASPPTDGCRPVVV